VDPIPRVLALGKGLGEYPLGGLHAAVQFSQGELIERAVGPIPRVLALGKGLVYGLADGPHAAVQVGQERR
jgi:hypothetical protein